VVGSDDQQEQTQIQAGLTQVEEDRSDDQRHDHISKELGDGQAWIGSETPEPSTETKFDLLTVGHGVGGASAAALSVPIQQRY
jgi:hypothetical protein